MSKGQIEALRERAREAGIGFDTWHPGDGVTRYRIVNLAADGATPDYFGGSDNDRLETALGFGAAQAWIEAFRAGRKAGIREAKAEVTRLRGLSGRFEDQALEAAEFGIDKIAERGAWIGGGKDAQMCTCGFERGAHVFGGRCPRNTAEGFHLATSANLIVPEDYRERAATYGG